MKINLQYPSGLVGMAFSIGTIDKHRGREKGVLVYPVYSRRSGGLSIGINLFPGKKQCPFDCPYCEVFPFSTNEEFSIEQLECDLYPVIDNAFRQRIEIKDICFSGNGEPTLSADFPQALELAGRIRGDMVPSAKIVLITNGAGLLQPEIFSYLQRAVKLHDLDIWLKLDAGTPLWYEKINRCKIPFEKLMSKIKEFTACTPVTIQTMFCAVDGMSPPEEEIITWENLILELVVTALENKTGGIRKIHLYGKARPAPEDPKASILPAEYLEGRAASLKKKLSALSPVPEVEVFL